MWGRNLWGTPCDRLSWQHTWMEWAEFTLSVNTTNEVYTSCNDVLNVNWYLIRVGAKIEYKGSMSEGTYITWKRMNSSWMIGNDLRGQSGSAVTFPDFRSFWVHVLKDWTKEWVGSYRAQGWPDERTPYFFLLKYDYYLKNSSSSNSIVFLDV